MVVDFYRKAKLWGDGRFALDRLRVSGAFLSDNEKDAGYICFHSEQIERTRAPIQLDRPVNKSHASP